MVWVEMEKEDKAEKEGEEVLVKVKTVLTFVLMVPDPEEEEVVVVVREELEGVVVLEVVLLIVYFHTMEVQEVS